MKSYFPLQFFNPLAKEGERGGGGERGGREREREREEEEEEERGTHKHFLEEVDSKIMFSSAIFQSTR